MASFLLAAKNIQSTYETAFSATSKWAKTQGEAYANFYWQDGYGAFSVSQSGVKEVIRYIDNQAQHHSQQSFQDEFRSLLEKYEVQYDERYVWD